MRLLLGFLGKPSLESVGDQTEVNASSRKMDQVGTLPLWKASFLLNQVWYDVSYPKSMRKHGRDDGFDDAADRSPRSSKPHQQDGSRVAPFFVIPAMLTPSSEKPHKTYVESKPNVVENIANAATCATSASGMRVSFSSAFRCYQNVPCGAIVITSSEWVANLRIAPFRSSPFLPFL